MRSDLLDEYNIMEWAIFEIVQTVSTAITKSQGSVKFCLAPTAIQSNPKAPGVRRNTLIVSRVPQLSKYMWNKYVTCAPSTSKLCILDLSDFQTISVSHYFGKLNACAP